VNRVEANPKEAPASDQIEISVFGPGFGECVLVHVGDGHWVIIDSCMNRAVRKPAALAYFDEIGIDPAVAVDMVLATHWHDDHVSGLDQVIEACSTVEFWCSDALRTTEFLTLVELKFTRPDLKFTRGVSCMDRVLKHVGDKVNFALCSMQIYKRIVTAPVEIWALSPSQYEGLLAKQHLKELLPTGEIESRISDRNPNHTAIALAILIGQEQIILGADLEESGDDRLGWSAIVANPRRPQLNATLFKIPHHGSATAHHLDTWTQLMARQPFTATTPYNKKTLLPTRSDVLRITTLATSSYVSKRYPFGSKKRRDNVVQKLVPRSLRSLPKRPGHIRFRKNVSASPGSWDVALFDGADLLSKFGKP
jgi:Metallo-beta-lactamase superfamily